MVQWLLVTKWQDTSTFLHCPNTSTSLTIFYFSIDFPFDLSRVSLCKYITNSDRKYMYFLFIYIPGWYPTTRSGLAASPSSTTSSQNWW